MVPPGGAGVGMHVIPVEKAISMEKRTHRLEKLSYWLSKYEGKIGVGRCSRRASRKAISEGVADDDYGWCIGVGDFADYCRETGKGHDITKKRLLKSYSVLRTTVSYIRSQISMERTRSLVSVTVT